MIAKALDQLFDRCFRAATAAKDARIDSERRLIMRNAERALRRIQRLNADTRELIRDLEGFKPSDQAIRLANDTCPVCGTAIGFDVALVITGQGLSHLRCIVEEEDEQ